jgi:integrase
MTTSTAIVSVQERTLDALDPLVETARGYAADARAKATRRSYAADWRTSWRGAGRRAWTACPPPRPSWRSTSPRLDEIGARDLKALEAQVRARGVDPRQHIILARVVMKTAHDFGELAILPQLPKMRRQPTKLPSAPARDVVERCLCGSMGWLHTAIALAFFTNLRNGEVRGLRVVDVGATAITVRKAISAGEEYMPKSRAERNIPIGPRLSGILAGAVKGRPALERVVLDDRGRSPTRQKLYAAFIALQRRLGIEPTSSFHSLRHAFGSQALQGGANVEAVRELMGHLDLRTTARYLHALQVDKAHAVNLLDPRDTGGQQTEGRPVVH